jgi:DNA-binding PadR family transcriptional regulator
MDSHAGSPLSTALFEILLSLAGGDQHGYAIMKEVEERTGGEVRLGPTSLYRSLKKLLLLGYIQEVPEDPGATEDDRRKVYRILDRGREAAARRADALARSVEEARRRHLLSGESPS